MEYKRDEQVIFLKDLLFIALYKWKAVIIWALILAVLLGGCKGIISAIDMKNEALQAENAQLQEMELEVYESKKANLTQQISVTRENARQQQKYLENSLLMNVDPYNYYEAYLSVFVDTNYQILPNMDYQNPDYTEPLINSYIEFFRSAENIAVLADMIGTEPEYIPELISAENPQSARSVILRVKAKDQSSAEQILQLMIQQIQQVQPDLSQSVAEHELRIKEQFTQQVINAELAQQQQEQSEKLTKLNDSIIDLQRQKDELLPPEAIVVSGSSIVKDSIIFAVIGGILGVFFVVLVVWIRHIAGSKVYSARTLTCQTGIKVLGCVDLTPATNPIDKKLRGLEGRNDTPVALQTTLLAATVSNLCGKEHRLLIISDSDTEYSCTLAQAISKAAPGLQVTCCGSLLSDIAALENLQQTDNVLLIAQCGASHYHKIRQQISLICDHNKQLLGCVLLDS